MTLPKRSSFDWLGRTGTSMQCCRPVDFRTCTKSMSFSCLPASFDIEEASASWSYGECSLPGPQKSQPLQLAVWVWLASVFRPVTLFLLVKVIFLKSSILHFCTFAKSRPIEETTLCSNLEIYTSYRSCWLTVLVLPTHVLGKLYFKLKKFITYSPNNTYFNVLESSWKWGEDP
jgi:hypothetical protein